MNTEKEIFYWLAKSEIYLPKYQLANIKEEIQRRTKKKESIFSVLNDIEKRPELKKYNNPSKGTYTVENKHQDYCAKVSKKVQQLDLNTGELIATHKSMYAAAKALNKSGGYSVISAAANGKINQAYGFKWVLV